MESESDTSISPTSKEGGRRRGRNLYFVAFSIIFVGWLNGSQMDNGPAVSNSDVHYISDAEKSYIYKLGFYITVSNFVYNNSILDFILVVTTP